MLWFHFFLWWTIFWLLSRFLPLGFLIVLSPFLNLTLIPLFNQLHFLPLFAKFLNTCLKLDSIGGDFSSILPTNLFEFRKGMGTMECLSTFIGNIYHSFNHHEFFAATLVDIRGTFDSVNIPTLITHLLSLQLLQVPPSFCNVLSTLFNFRKIVFSSPFGTPNVRSTFSGLPQGSCLSPVLFNVHMSIVEKHLSLNIVL